MSESLETEIRQYAKKLRLGENIATFTKAIPFEDPETYVRDLLRAVWDARVKDRIHRSRQLAGFPQIKTLENYSTDCLELPKGLDFSWFSECHFIESKRNLILLGNPGTGKTHLATALGIEACNRGQKVYFRRMANFV